MRKGEETMKKDRWWVGWEIDIIILIMAFVFAVVGCLAIYGLFTLLGVL